MNTPRCPAGRAYIPAGVISTEQLNLVLARLRYVPRANLRQAVDYETIREWLASDRCPDEHRKMVEEWQERRRAWREERHGPRAPDALEVA